MDIMEFVERAMLVPFKPKGRSFDGWDCWGVIYVAYREILGIELPSYSTEYSSTKPSEKLERFFNRDSRIQHGWRDLLPGEKSRTMDCVLMHRQCRALHVGLFIEPNRVLHSEAGTNTLCQPMAGPEWEHSVGGVFRYVAPEGHS